MLKELPMRRMSALAYLLIVCSIALPIWWVTTDIERVPFDVLPETYTIDFNIRLVAIRFSFLSAVFSQLNQRYPYRAIF